MKKVGKVYLVGAGPGDPGLITIRALEAIRSADCIIYDFLANPTLLSNHRGELIYVGKKGGDHTLPQDHINKLMIEKAKEGKIVVRLKGGDPFIFGRGGEEAEELIRHSIPFEIIPGISSFYAVPAYAGIPITHRDFADRFEVITGHRRSDTEELLEIGLPEYRPHKTFIFLMGMKNLEQIVKTLIEEKRFPPNIPVAVISWGTTPHQSVAVGTLSSIAQQVFEAKLTAPAIIVIGEVVTLRETLRWFDVRPLFGKKVVVTRTREQASELSQKLTNLGAEVIEFPTIKIKPRENMDIHNAISHLSSFDWIVFTSQNAVNIFFNHLKKHNLDARAFHSARIAAIGNATASSLEAHGIRCDLVPEKFIAEALVEALESQAIRGEKILLPCAAEARDVLYDGLQKAGAYVTRVFLYDTVLPDDLDEDVISAAKLADVITFASSTTVKNFFALIPDTKAIFACIGPITAQTVRDHGKNPEIIAETHTIDGLVSAIVQYFETHT
ncbi:MAG: uroporphyrinogen-III C-methyltransferase [Spirochaetes bacterium]|nr:uroporphyrinogen-III C-methyltransferase [Spirochaetota bacterium]